MKYLKILYRLLVYLNSFIVFSGDTKKSSEKKALKMTSQLVIFRAFFAPPSNPKSDFFPRKSTNKKILTLAKADKSLGTVSALTLH